MIIVAIISLSGAVAIARMVIIIIIINPVIMVIMVIIIIIINRSARNETQKTYSFLGVW